MIFGARIKETSFFTFMTTNALWWLCVCSGKKKILSMCFCWEIKESKCHLSYTTVHPFIPLLLVEAIILSQIWENKFTGWSVKFQVRFFHDMGQTKRSDLPRQLVCLDFLVVSLLNWSWFCTWVNKGLMPSCLSWVFYGKTTLWSSVLYVHIYLYIIYLYVYLMYSVHSVCIYSDIY